jgi:hypothetical protein
MSSADFCSECLSLQLQKKVTAIDADGLRKVCARACVSVCTRLCVSVCTRVHGKMQAVRGWSDAGLQCYFSASHSSVIVRQLRSVEKHLIPKKWTCPSKATALEWKTANQHLTTPVQSAFSRTHACTQKPSLQTADKKDNCTVA